MLVEMQGGTINVEIKKGEGSTFTTHLPIAGPERADIRAAQVARLISRSYSPHSRVNRSPVSLLQTVPDLWWGVPRMSDLGQLQPKRTGSERNNQKVT